MAERVWDRFLTEQDRVIAQVAREEPVGFGTRPALLLIDLYRWVFGDGPEPILDAVKTWPSSCGLAAWEAIPHIQRLLKAGREAGIPVVHVTGLEDHESGVLGWKQSIHGGKRVGLGTPYPDDRRRRRYDIVEEVGPVAGETLLRKTAPSAFWGTPLMAHLNHLDVDTLIIAGEATSGCVRASVVDAASYRFRVIVAEECVFDQYQATHAMNLFDMNQKYADVLPLEEIEAFLREWRLEHAATNGKALEPAIA